MNTKDNVSQALEVLDDYILKQRMGLYIYLRKQLTTIPVDQMRDYIESLISVEELLINQTNSIKRAKNTNSLFDPEKAGLQYKKDLERQMSLRKIMDDIKTHR
jgi:hypothetical protein